MNGQAQNGQQFAMGAQPPGQPEAGATSEGQSLLMASLSAAELMVTKTRGTQSGAEAKDWAQAALALTQTIALLDPTRDQQGIPLDHHVALEQMKADAQLQQVKEKARAQAPAPSGKKQVSVRRDQHGRANSYTVEES
jgi:hypothetical protein